MTAEVAETCRWDWYEGTTFGVDADTVASTVARAYGWQAVGVSPVTVGPCRGMHGYLRGAAISKGDETLCEITWGGNPGVHLKASGASSPQLWKVINALKLEHSCEWSPSRVDAAVDWIEAGLFDRLAGPAMQFADARGIVIDQQGDWHRGKGRSLYLGAKTSVVRLNLYEKGYQLGGGADPNWVRWEVRVRPKGHARLEVGTWAPHDALGASTWLVDLQRELGLGERFAHSVGTVWRPSDTDRARRALIRQYARVMHQWFEEVGTWEQLGVELGTRVVSTIEHSTLQNLLQPVVDETGTEQHRELSVAGAGPSE